MDPSVQVDMQGGDDVNEPLLVGGSSGRPRPRQFTFAEFIVIPYGPLGLPLDARTGLGLFMIGVVSCIICVGPIL